MLSIMRFKVFFSRYIRILQNDKFVHRQKNGVLTKIYLFSQVVFYIYIYRGRWCSVLSDLKSLKRNEW